MTDAETNAYVREGKEWFRRRKAAYAYFDSIGFTEHIREQAPRWAEEDRLHHVRRIEELLAWPGPVDPRSSIAQLRALAASGVPIEEIEERVEPKVPDGNGQRIAWRRRTDPQR
jgi:hypothetical protein